MEPYLECKHSTFHPFADNLWFQADYYWDLKGKCNISGNTLTPANSKQKGKETGQ